MSTPDLEKYVDLLPAVVSVEYDEPDIGDVMLTLSLVTYLENWKEDKPRWVDTLRALADLLEQE